MLLDKLMYSKFIVVLLLASAVVAMPPANSYIAAYSGDGNDVITGPYVNPPCQIPSAHIPAAATMPLPIPGEETSPFQGNPEHTIRPQDKCYSPPQWARYCKKFNIKCPWQGLWIFLGSPGLIWITVNGQLIQNSPIDTPVSGQWVFIDPEFLKCGCNDICFCVYGYCPYLWYRMWFPKQTCMKECANIKNAFFDHRECTCQCIDDCCKQKGYTIPKFPINRSCACRGKFIAATTIRAPINRG